MLLRPQATDSRSVEHQDWRAGVVSQDIGVPDLQALFMQVQQVNSRSRKALQDCTKARMSKSHRSNQCLSIVRRHCTRLKAYIPLSIYPSVTGYLKMIEVHM